MRGRSCIWFNGAKLLGGLLREQGVEIDFLDAVRLAALFENGEDFDVPVVVLGERFPVARELAFFVAGVGGGVDDQVEGGRDFFNSPQNPAEKGGELAAIGARARLFEKMIVPAVQNPGFKRDARGVWAKGVVIALDIHDALAEFFFLADDVAENATLLVLVPFVRGNEFILDAARHENCGGDLGIGMDPFLAGLSALIFENSDVFEARVFLEIGDARAPDGKDVINFVVGELRETLVMDGSFHHDFVGAERPHFVVNAFRSAAGIDLDAV